MKFAGFGSDGLFGVQGFGFRVQGPFLGFVALSRKGGRAEWHSCSAVLADTTQPVALNFEHYNVPNTFKPKPQTGTSI